MSFLNDWRARELPAAVSGITATEVIVGASNKLTDITPVLKIANLAKLDLTKLTKLEVSGQVRLNMLEVLHVEDVPKWTDFSNLSSSSLEELELFTKADSLSFLSQLPGLKKLYFWDVKDGDMEPVLAHPSLREVYFEPHKKHYSQGGRAQCACERQASEREEEVYGPVIDALVVTGAWWSAVR